MTLQFSPDQNDALDMLHQFVASKSRAMALVGPAGSGKTTVLREFCAQTTAEHYLTATTNKAAKVAAAGTSGEPKTIHSLLGLQPYDNHDIGKTMLKRRRDPDVKIGSLVIIDESSMIATELLDYILRDALLSDLKILFVGDEYQLPPVFESRSPAFDRVPTVRLTTIHRQARENPVLSFANDFRLVLDGEPFPRIEPRGNTVSTMSESRFIPAMLERFDDAKDEDDVRAVAYTNVLVLQLNRVIRRYIIGPAADVHRFIPGEKFIVNSAVTGADDEVIIPTEGGVTIVNVEPAEIDYEGPSPLLGERVTVRYSGVNWNLFVPLDLRQLSSALSGLSGAAKAIQAECMKYQPREVPEKLEVSRRVAWGKFFDLKNSVSDLRPPFASTVHKTQGSTYQDVFIDVANIGRCTRSDVVARLMYVATSRAAGAVTMMGDLPPRLYRSVAA